jgi:hypothetical protein
MKLFVLVGCLLTGILADTYLTNPRGSNNRLNEATATRTNNNRLFNSQNNARGGHNTGDKFHDAAGTDPKKQYSMQYYASGPTEDEASKLIVEWTNQHGCGGNADSPHKTNCNIVIQMMCMSNGTEENYPEGTGDDEDSIMERNLYIREGVNTNTQNYDQPNTNEINGDDWDTKNDNYNARVAGNYENVQTVRGLHETVWWYDMCRYREANGGLYRADQNLGTGSLGYIGSERTRQNNGGTRRGYECPEERDYYPYWQPTHQAPYMETDFSYQRTPWIDLAYLSGNASDCDRVAQGSENQNGKYRCVMPEESSRSYGRSINEEDCAAEEGTWVMFHSYLEVIDAAETEAQCNAYITADSRNRISWMALRSDSENYKCVVQAPLPQCGQAPWTRVNHLGNSIDTKGNASRWETELPHFPSGTAKRCVMRLRYNITTDEFDAYSTDHRHNYDLEAGVISPVEDNPFIDVANISKPLRLAMNTNQYGRTFQDRTHAYVVLPRTAAMSGKILHNLNVRGKRGNIVQTFPAVEYDFVPNKLALSEEDLLHIQWTGSNTHNNGGNGGDGQTGDAGEGTGGTDRHNFLQMKQSDLNYPVPFENSTFWEMVESVNFPGATALDMAVGYATSGYYCGYNDYGECAAGNHVTDSTRDAFQQQLNNAAASYFGHVLKFKGPGTCVYVCTRNNNFTNRSQKGVLWVTPAAAEGK